MFTEEILKMLFSEYSEDEDAYEKWVESSGYDSSWTDKRIYEALPSELYEYLGEFGINASWMHDGM